MLTESWIGFFIYLFFYLFPGLTGSRPSTLQDVVQALGLSVMDVVPEEPGAGMKTGSVDL